MSINSVQYDWTTCYACNTLTHDISHSLTNDGLNTCLTMSPHHLPKRSSYYTTAGNVRWVPLDPVETERATIHPLYSTRGNLQANPVAFSAPLT